MFNAVTTEKACIRMEKQYWKLYALTGIIQKIGYVA